MTDTQHVPTQDAAAAEPAVTDATPQVDQAAPASDATPEPQVETTAPEPQASSPDPTAEELERLRAEKEQWDRQQDEYRQWQQAQAQAAQQRQAQAVREQYEAQLNDLANRVTAVDTTDEARKLINEHINGLLRQVGTQFQQREQQLQQHFVSERQRDQEEFRRHVDEIMVPRFAEQVLQQYGLPDQFKDALLKAKTPDDMPAIAQTIQTMLNQSAPQAQQQVAARQADAHRQQNTFAVGGASGGPIPQRELAPMKATSPESLSALANILGYGDS